MENNIYNQNQNVVLNHEELAKNFTHLHVHTNFSLLDGASDIKGLVKKAKENGQKALAITDHGNMHGIIEFYKECKKQGVKPIIGCEVYVAPGSRFDRESVQNSAADLFVNARYHHLVLLAKNEKGYQNLMELVSRGYSEGFYYKPRIDLDILEEHSEGLIASSACLGGAVSQAFLKGGFEESLEVDDVNQKNALLNQAYQNAKETALKYQAIFGDDYYLELQNHGIMEQEHVNKMLVQLSQDTGIEMVVANDSHYTNKEDSEVHNILLRIQIGATLEDEVKLEFKTDEFYLKTYEEMREAFPGEVYDKAFYNTGKIADQCNVEIEFHNYKLPKYDYPEKVFSDFHQKEISFNNSVDYLKYLTYISYERYMESFHTNQDVYNHIRLKFKDESYEEIREIYLERLKHELDIIISMGFPDYFLIVWDFVKFAKDNDILVGPGRGSAAGSLVSFLLEITEVDPIPVDLYFERFLNPERVSMPDIDIDFERERRSEVIDYVFEKYGEDHVAQIATFGTLAALSSIRDVTNVVNSDKATSAYVNRILKTCPNGSIDDFFEESETFREAYRTNDVFKYIIDVAKQIEGFPRHTSIHAAGVVISDRPLYEHIPTFVSKGVRAVQFNMDEVEELGLLKMDFLGIRNLTIIKDAERLINEDRVRKGLDPDFDILKISNTDPNTLDLLEAGDTSGVFQLSSPGMKDTLRGLKPKNLSELTNVISLYRPGPMENIGKYIYNKAHPDQIAYDTPELEEILSSTYGIMVYQEQVMQIARDLAGFSLGQADVLRRAMGSKDMDIMNEQRKNFVYGVNDGDVVVEGCVNRGIPEDVANRIYDSMLEFANYAFNKSHGYCYSIVAYRIAYLKANYPLQYSAALLSSVINDSDSLAEYLSDISDMGVEVSKPDVSISDSNFTTDGEKVYYGLRAIDSVGVDIVKNIIKERELGEFTSFFNFVYRLRNQDLTITSLTNLIKAGALDDFGDRASMLHSAQEFMDISKKMIDKYDDGNLFEYIEDFNYEETINFELEKVPPLSPQVMLEYEKEVLSFYVSGNPLDLYYIGDAYKVEELRKTQDREYRNIIVMAFANDFKEIKTYKGDRMAYVSLEGEHDKINGVIFPDAYAKYGEIFKIERSDTILLLKGNLGMREGDKQFIINDVYLPPRSEDEFKYIVKTTNLRYQKISEIEERRRSNKERGVSQKTGLYIKLPNGKNFKATVDYFQKLSRKANDDDELYTVYVYVHSQRQLFVLNYGITKELAEYVVDLKNDKNVAVFVE